MGFVNMVVCVCVVLGPLCISISPQNVKCRLVVLSPIVFVLFALQQFELYCRTQRRSRMIKIHKNKKKTYFPPLKKTQNDHFFCSFFHVFLVTTHYCTLDVSVVCVRYHNTGKVYVLLSLLSISLSLSPSLSYLQTEINGDSILVSYNNTQLKKKT